MATILRAEHIRKTYHMGKTEVEVLRDAGLDVAAGESVAVVGASGAGKSTLLHILGGLDTPDDGEVLLEGESLYGMSPRKRAYRRATVVGFVFQSYHLLPEMDVMENVLLPAMAVPGSERGKARDRAAELLAAVGLSARAAHRPLELSGGEQQRVALARALMNTPRMVLADEPTGNLDDETGSQVLDYLFETSRSAGHSLVLVTHSRQTAARCDRVLHLEAGALREA